MIDDLNFIAQQSPTAQVYWKIPGLENEDSMALEVQFRAAKEDPLRSGWQIKGQDDAEWRDTDAEGIWLTAVEKRADIYRMRQNIYETVRALVANNLLSPSRPTFGKPSMVIPKTPDPLGVVQDGRFANPLRSARKSPNGLLTPELRRILSRAYKKRTLH